VAPNEGTFVNRLWNRIAVRVASVGLLAGGLVGGVYLGQQQGVQAQSGHVDVAQVDAAEIRLLRERHAQHAAARAYQREAADEAAAKAGAEAKSVAGKARTLEKEAIEKKAAKKKAASSGATVPYTGPIPSSCSEYSGNRATGCALMLQASFKIDQFPCLEKLWTKESGWNHRASNASSGAYGIPQAYPGSKMGSIAADWRTNPATQIKWGLGYVKGKYNTPCGAWSHFQSAGSY
jgi:hypothetical protein